MDVNIIMSQSNSYLSSFKDADLPEPPKAAMHHEVGIYTGEDLKPHTVGVLCFKSLPIPRH